MPAGGEHKQCSNVWVSCCVVAWSARGRNNARAGWEARRAPGGEDGDKLNCKWESQGQSHWEGHREQDTERGLRSGPCDIQGGRSFQAEGTAPSPEGAGVSRGGNCPQRTWALGA